MKKKMFLILWSFIFLSVLSMPGLAQGPQKKEQKKEAKVEEDQSKFTETITVEAKVPRDFPFSTMSFVGESKIETVKPKTVAEALSFTPSVYISNGIKHESLINLRGLDNTRIAFLYDGIPVYEPYYNMFDLKQITMNTVDRIKIVKGATSVLYGANALGGVVDISSKRPAPPAFNLSGNYGTRNSYSLAPSGSLRFGNFIVSGSFLQEKSDGFNYRADGEIVKRLNSDYRRTDYSAKVYYYPGKTGEILGEINYMNSAYGLPVTTTSFWKPFYWRFPEWERLMFNLGGSFPLMDSGNIKLRTFYVKHYNVFDTFKNDKFQDLLSESTYNNYSYGAFALATLPLSEQWNLRGSINYRLDHAEIQDALHLPWNKYDQKVFSTGAELSRKFGSDWEAMAGVSIDNLTKEQGKNKTSINPIAGIKYSPIDYLHFHASASRKSRFPSMKNLYAVNGNPNLTDELGTSFELGFAIDRWVSVSGAIFTSQIKDMIMRIMLPDQTFTFENIALSRINGFELEVSKATPLFSVTAAYTYLDAKNKTDKIPLDLSPHSQFNLVGSISPNELFTFSVWGIAVSSTTYKGNSKVSAELAGYTLLNACLEKRFQDVRIYLKGENLLNKAYFTQPGFPMRAFTLTVGFDLSLGGAVQAPSL